MDEPDINRYINMTIDELNAVCRAFDAKMEAGTITELEMEAWSVATAAIGLRYEEQRLEHARKVVAQAAIDFYEELAKAREGKSNPVY